MAARTRLGRTTRSEASVGAESGRSRSELFQQILQSTRNAFHFCRAPAHVLGSDFRELVPSQEALLKWQESLPLSRARAGTTADRSRGDWMAAAVQEGQDQDDHVEADAVRKGGMARANPTIGEDLRIRKRHRPNRRRRRSSLHGSCTRALAVKERSEGRRPREQKPEKCRPQGATVKGGGQSARSSNWFSSAGISRRLQGLGLRRNGRRIARHSGDTGTTPRGT